MRRQFERLSRPLRRRVMLMIGRAELTVVDDARKLQTVQVEGLAGEVLDRVERMQQYGVTSHPHAGAEALLLALGGMRQHPVVVAVDDRRHRPTGLSEGEVCLYTSEDGAGGAHRVVLKNGRKVHVQASGEIRLECGSVSLVISQTGVEVTGLFKANHDDSQVGGVTVKTHDHPKGTLKDAENRPLLSGDTGDPN